jgi:hypothetical protein
MSYLTTDPASRATSTYRAQIVAEAVVSAYINEITPAERSRERARARHSCTGAAPRAFARSRLAARARNLQPYGRTANRRRGTLRP